MNENILKYGVAEDLPERTVLKAGKLSVVYQNGFIRQIKCGRYEIIRMINHALRDENWATCPFEIQNEQIHESKDSFHISYDAVINYNHIAFTWKCKIEGHSGSRVIFEIEGTAASGFKKNRAGFTVLHPLTECVGKPVEIVQVDGSLLSGNFPEFVAPHQPFRHIKGMNWHVSDSIRAKLSFEGDVFEMEDQRNWMDASYKTYCTPLDLPFPVKLEKGDQVLQKITLDVNAEIDQAIAVGHDPVNITISDQHSKFPFLGIGKSTEVKKLSLSQLELLRSLGFDRYRVDVHLSDPGWQDHVKQAFSEAQAMDCMIELGLFTEEKQNSISSIEFDPEIIDQIELVTLYADDEKTISDARVDSLIGSARRLFPNAKVGAGTDAFFTELNRHRIHSDQVDYLSFSTNPQVHAFDNDSWVETLEAIPYMLRTCTDFARNKAIHVSPLTFKMRWNPNATGEQPLDPAGTVPRNADVRQMSRFGAAWTLGALKHFVEAGVDYVTLFETVGMKGLMPDGATSLHPFTLLDHYPLFYLIDKILSFKQYPILHCSSDQPLRCEALCFDAKDHIIMILANYTGQHLNVHFPNLLTNSGTVFDVLSSLEESTFSENQMLEPYQVVSIDMVK